MKKIISFLLMIFTIFGLSSCHKNIEKINIKRDINVEQAIDLYATKQDKPNLNELKINKESFLLYVYVPGCLNCSFFGKMYDEYVKDNHAVLYKCDISDVNTLENKAPQVAPYLAIYRKGEMSETFEFSSNEEIFKNKESFEEFMDKYFILDEMSKMPTLTKETLDAWIKDNKEFIVYFGWNKCSDCTYMNDNYLNSFLKENDKTIYYFETDPYHPSKDSTIEEEKIWSDFKMNYGFGKYNGGRVPSFCYFKDGQCEDFAVYLNDVFEFDDDNDTVKVVDSYYKDNPNIGKTFYGDSVMDSYSNYKDSSKEFFNKKMDEFFDKYLK